jgi:hypothetical protein
MGIIQKMTRTFAIAIAVLMAAQIGDGTVAAQQKVVSLEVIGDFKGKKGASAVDLSGVACMPPRADGSRLCLFVNDESRHAQFGVFAKGTITPGDVLPLIGKEPSDATFGTPPETECPVNEGKFGEFDGEGVAYAAPYFYVVGSHGCSREGAEFRLSSFMLARIRVDAEGRPAGADGQPLALDEWQEAVETTYRLSDYLAKADKVSGFFGKSLDETEMGLNIEGLAVDGDRLLVGLRAPALGDAAYLVTADIADLFRPGKGAAKGKPEVLPVKLGKTMGIRDLASLPDGRLLVLAGSAQKQLLPYRLFLVEPGKRGKPKLLAELEPVKGGEAEDEEEPVPAKAEAVTVLSADAGELRVLILFDGVENGAPREMRLRLD